MAAESGDEKSWEDTLRKMLPAGAPLPDEEQLDYSIAVEYEGPPVPYEVPTVDPLELDSLSIRTSSMVSVSDIPSSIPVAAPIVCRVSRFSPVNNGCPVRGSRCTPVWRAQSDLSKQGNCVIGGGLEEEPISSAAESAPNPSALAFDEDKRTNVVTFRTPRDSESEDDGYSSSAALSSDAIGSPVAPQRSGEENESKKKKTKKKIRGVCSRCGKGNRLREKEWCLVCDARYCSNCLLKAMGSMPEGRKCVGCIGQPIDESKRSSLGKCSRLLSRLCSPLEVRQIMKAERECPANQLRPEQLIVNGRQLRQDELSEILGCPLPPQKLKPGRYWYDKDSGLWGKVKTIRSILFKCGIILLIFISILLCCYFSS